MMNYKEILRKAVDANIVNIKEYNDRIEVFLTYRIVWETQNHMLLHPFPTEKEAQDFVNNREGYYYQRILL